VKNLLVCLHLCIFFGSSITLADKARLKNHIPHGVTKATHLGRLTSTGQFALTIALNLKNQADLARLINRQHDPTDPLFGKFLTPQQFAQSYGPDASDFASVENYLSANHLNVVGKSTNTLQVMGSINDIEKSFNFEMHQYQSSDRRTVFAPNLDPEVDSEIAPKIAGILGLNNFSRFVGFRRRRDQMKAFSLGGTGPGGGLSPSDIAKGYSLNGLNANGAGQTLALMELDGYTSSDISKYATQFNISHPPQLQNVLIDGYDGSAGSGADEVTLDIELMMAVAPGASKIMVYEGTNTETGPLDVYAKIADDNIAKEVSTSWGSPESQNTSSFLNSENAIFMQMAAQGQSIYAAAGDSGAYDDGSHLSVDDPGSQPYMVSVGGTTLTTNSDGSYQKESSWGITTPEQGGGGGISSVWPQPSWQSGLATSANKGSTTMRMVPDVSLDANPQTGYAIYVGGVWNTYGGTSCAAPIWAAFTALVNQQRTANGLPLLGFANPALYQLGSSGLFNQVFNDIKDNSTNLYYSAIPGYDLSTGWGSMKASSLLAGFSAPSASNLNSPTGVIAAPHNQVAAISWSASAGALSYVLNRASSSAGPFTQVASNILGTSYADTGLQNGTTYFYEVVATNITSQSGPSAIVSVAPAAMPPQAPTNFTTTP